MLNASIMKRIIKNVYNSVRFGKLNHQITVKNNFTDEIAVMGRGNKMVGFWFNGGWHPDFPYRG